MAKKFLEEKIDAILAQNEEIVACLKKMSVAAAFGISGTKGEKIIDVTPEPPPAPTIEADDIGINLAEEAKLTLTVEQVVAATQKCVKDLGGDQPAVAKVVPILAKFGAKKAQEVKPEDREAYLTAIGKLKK